MTRNHGWINKIAICFLISLWLIASFILVAGFAKTIYLNDRTIPLIGVVINNSYDETSVYVHIIAYYDGVKYIQEFVFRKFYNASEARDYMIRHWSMNSQHPCLLVNESELSLHVRSEYWSFIAAGIFLILAFLSGIGLVIYQYWLMRKRKNYRDLDEPQDFVLISTKDLDKDMRNGEYPSTCGRSAMDSFDEAQALFWIFMPSLIKHYGIPTIDELKSFQIKCLTGTQADRFQFQQDVERILIQLG